MMKVYAPMRSFLPARVSSSLSMLFWGKSMSGFRDGLSWYSVLFTLWVYDHRRKGSAHEAEYGSTSLPLLDGPCRWNACSDGISGRSPKLRIAERGGISGEYMCCIRQPRVASSYPPSYAEWRGDLQEGKSPIVALPTGERAAREVAETDAVQISRSPIEHPGRLSVCNPERAASCKLLVPPTCALVLTPTVGSIRAPPAGLLVEPGPHVSTLVPMRRSRVQRVRRKPQPKPACAALPPNGSQAAGNVIAGMQDKGLHLSLTPAMPIKPAKLPVRNY